MSFSARLSALGTLGLVALLVVPAPSVFAELDRRRVSPFHLESGKAVSGAIRLPDGAARYLFRVPPTAFGVVLEMSGADADLDMGVLNGGDVVAISRSESFNERIVITRLSDPPLVSGEYEVEIYYQHPDPPHRRASRAEESRFTLTWTAWIPVPEPVTPGKPVQSTLRAEDGMLKSFMVDVPPGQRALRIDLYDATADLDIMASRGQPTLDRGAAEHRAESLLSRESLVIRAPEGGWLVPGRYFFSVYDYPGGNEEESFSLIAGFSSEAPRMLLDYPPIRQPRDPLERALAATVEILAEDGAGSGCLVSKDGHILTNLHVLMRADGKSDPEPIVALTLSPELPARELFRAVLVKSDPQLDLALLKITSGLYGQPLPPGMSLPFFTVAENPPLSIGEPLAIIGYPGIGGTGSRATITFTRGVVSGFVRSPAGRLIKTDAEINEGNSGGAAVNARFELVGLPTQVIGSGSGQLGYITPVTGLPWLAELR